jgi:hypothetical protein
MSIKYKRSIIIEKGLREFSDIEKVCFRLEDSLKERNKNGRLFFKFNENLNKKNSTDSFKLKLKITPEIIQDMSNYGNIDAEAELNGLLLENLENEVLYSVLVGNMLRRVTNLRTILIEKKQNNTYINKLSLESLFNLILKKFRHYKLDLIVSNEILGLLHDMDSFIISTERVEDCMYAMGFEKVGYFLYHSNLKEITIYKSPYFPANKCLAVKNLRSPEFSVTLNSEEMTYDINTFAPSYKNHYSHIKIPDNVRYHGFEIDGIEPYKYQA